MVKYIIRTPELADILIDRISNAIALSGEWGDGITNKYCDAKLHPTQNLAAVIISERYISFLTSDEIAEGVELTEDWKPIQKPLHPNSF